MDRSGDRGLIRLRSDATIPWLMFGQPFRKTWAGKAWALAAQKYYRLQREAYQRLLPRSTDKRILLVVGCQRSGTTMIGNVLARDLRSAVLQEQSCITRDRSLRLKPYHEVNRILHSLRAQLVVAKPIVETQWTPELLAHISDSRALWMFRHYGDVVRSNVKRFSTQREGLRMAITGNPPSWRSERLSPQTHRILQEHYRDDIRREDAAALGWYARNVLFFELGLDRRRDVLLCKYEDLVNAPERTLAAIYEFIELLPPRRQLSRVIDDRSVGLGNSADVAEPIRELCENLWTRLLQCYRAPSSPQAFDGRAVSERQPASSGVAV